ncbi:MAG: NAD(P)H-dependent oxidoreductase [Granulosicoccus sp.]
MSVPLNSRKVLRVDASARFADSVTRSLASTLIEGLVAQGLAGDIVIRDLASGVEFVDEAWVGANFTAEADRTAAQQSRLNGSDALVNELLAAELLIIASPIYNFSVPAALKAWIDQITRVGRTFRYGENGPVGLLKDMPVYLVIASGGTAVNSEIDFATGYLRHILGFIGLTKITIIKADQGMSRGEQTIIDARAAVQQSIQNLSAQS